MKYHNEFESFVRRRRGLLVGTANEFSLEIAGPQDRRPLGDYRGKLVVMLQSRDVTKRPAGTEVTVGGRPGTISTVDPTATQLYYSDGRQEIVVQAASELGLTDAELVEFAESVTVTADAVAGRG